MGRPAKYPAEFRREAVELGPHIGPADRGGGPQHGVTDSTLHNWLKADRDSRERDGNPEALTESERAELARLRKENAKVRMDREILRKAKATGRYAVVDAGTRTPS